LLRESPLTRLTGRRTASTSGTPRSSTRPRKPAVRSPTKLQIPKLTPSSLTAGLHNSDAAVLTVSPPAGVSFGCSDFRAYNMGFANRAQVNGVEIIGQQTGPSAAFFSTAANSSLYSCTFDSYQDTWYTGKGASSLVYSEYSTCYALSGAVKGNRCTVTD
jgi:hypothetical protein